MADSVIRWGGWGDGQERVGDPPEGAYLEWYDLDVDPATLTPHIHPYTGLIARFTTDPAKALRFPNGPGPDGTAFDVWRKQSAKYPTRPWDGKPNRPLSGFNAIVEKAPEPDTLGNWVRREGVDFCACGCKYWENDRCVDCGATEPVPE